MEFEHYIQQGQQKLRCGYTTGTCAALAGKAAVRMLLGGQKTEEISVLTPKGLWVTTAVEEIQSGDGWVSCGVRKDAGDDIDVTAQSLICVKAKKNGGNQDRYRRRRWRRQGDKARSGTAGRCSGDQFCPAADDFAGGGGRVPGRRL